ncbi:DUF5985 family protein [Legionella sp. km772]|uniref:DUF5985 family protein n=1 Tax=Legionella sp. km772 TaxID=2498111 RepID=UPI000F8C387B|nr:DUF5985 family protein [Legionella sp. km772]RUR08706.1 hypothetical protein ELY15_10300 [Legionella sp. km772]
MINPILVGAFIMASIVVSLFFFRFWKTTRDRFFLFFAFSFAIEGLNRIILEFSKIPEQEPLAYLLRLFAYLLIIVAILDKNKRSNHSEP